MKMVKKKYKRKILLFEILTSFWAEGKGQRA